MSSIKNQKNCGELYIQRDVGIRAAIEVTEMARRRFRLPGIGSMSIRSFIPPWPPAERVWMSPSRELLHRSPIKLKSDISSEKVVQGAFEHLGIQS
jgi:hypothetical protein